MILVGVEVQVLQRQFRGPAPPIFLAGEPEGGGDGVGLRVVGGPGRTVGRRAALIHALRQGAGLGLPDLPVDKAVDQYGGHPVGHVGDAAHQLPDPIPVQIHGGVRTVPAEAQDQGGAVGAVVAAVVPGGPQAIVQRIAVGAQDVGEGVECGFGEAGEHLGQVDAVPVLGEDPGLLPHGEEPGPALLSFHLPVRLRLRREGGHLHPAGGKPEIPEAGDAVRLPQEGKAGALGITEKTLGGKGGGLPAVGRAPVRQCLLDTVQQVHPVEGILPRQVAVGLPAAVVEPQRVGVAVPVQVGGVGGLGAVGQQPGDALLVEHIVVPGGVGGAPGGRDDEAALTQQGGELPHVVAAGVGALLHGEAEELVPLPDGPVLDGVAARLPIAQDLLTAHKLQLC